MSTHHLGIDDEDFSMDIVPRIEASFGFRFDKYDLVHVRTFGEFCEAVLAKLPTAYAADCTTQQAFYKLRRALRNYLPMASILPATALADILPASRYRRRYLVAAVEAEVGFKLQLLGATSTIITGGCLLLVTFAVTLFFNKYVGGAGLALTLAALHIADKIGGNIKVETIRDAVEQMSSRNYQQSRRNPASANRAEIISRLKFLFTHDFGLEISQLTPDALL